MRLLYKSRGRSVAHAPTGVSDIAFSPRVLTMSFPFLKLLPERAGPIGLRHLPERGHVLLRGPAREDKRLPDSSGRLSLPDDIEIPDTVVFSDRRGR